MRLAQLIAGVVDAAKRQCSSMSWHQPESVPISFDLNVPSFNSRVLVDGEPIPHMAGFVIYDDGQDVGPRCIVEVITTPPRLDAEADNADTAVVEPPLQQVERIEGVLLTGHMAAQFHDWRKEQSRARREELGDKIDQARADGRTT